jgi:hypothetical protein
MIKKIFKYFISVLLGSFFIACAVFVVFNVLYFRFFYTFPDEKYYRFIFSLSIILGIAVFIASIYILRRISPNKLIIANVIIILLIYGFMLFAESIETEAIYTGPGVLNFLTLRCYNGAGGNSWCDDLDRCIFDDCGTPEQLKKYREYKKQKEAGFQEKYYHPRMVWDQILGR